jgi:triphosphoribosyl-dephospho-CoA synthase
MLSPGQQAALACLWEATARKPGNVHRFQDFDDLSYVDFLHSAVAIVPVLDQALEKSVGRIVLDGVRATQFLVAGNTNLGILLLLAPLVRVPVGQKLAAGIQGVLEGLDVHDARMVYEAIRLARPGGLGQVPEQDVTTEPTLDLRGVMALAAERDLIALQYVNNFHQVLDEGVSILQHAIQAHGTLEAAIVTVHLQLMARYPDSLIARKRGLPEALEASRRARAVLEAGWPTRVEGREAVANLDRWLRAPGQDRNPGTTADLVAASLFAALHDDIIMNVPWSNS